VLTKAGDGKVKAEEGVKNHNTVIEIEVRY
jgi:hypothetical protein